MKALITGISGFVGTNLTKLLLDENIEVIGIDVRINSSSSLEQYETDINDLDKLKKIIGSTKPDYMYHLAAPAFIPDSYENPQKTFTTIIDGTVALLEAIRHQSPYTKLLFVGSSDEYGEYCGVPFSEKMLPLPCTPYASAKAAASIICYQYSRFYDVNVLRTRSFNHMGPGQSPRFVSARMAKQIAELEKSDETEIVMGNLETSRDFLDVRDVVKAYYLIMSLKDNSGELYNICSGRHTTIAQILDAFLNLTNLRSRDGFKIASEQQSRKFDNIQICGDNSKLREQTGWTESYSLDDTIKDTLNYWRTQV